MIWLKKVEYYKYQKQFWCYKVTANSNLIKHWKIISKNKSFAKIKDYFNKNIDINKIVVSSKSISVEMNLNISSATKILKNWNFIHISSKKERFDTRDFDETKYMSFCQKM